MGTFAAALGALAIVAGCASARTATSDPQSDDTSGKRVERAPLRIAAPRCTPGREPQPRLPTARELADAFTAVRPDVQHCMSLHGVDAPLQVDVKVEGARGRIVASSARIEPKDDALDACVAAALAPWCIDPFVPMRSQPLLELRLPFVPANE